MQKNKYNSIQNWRRRNNKVNYNNKYDINGNKIYSQSIDYNGSIIEHYFTYDKNNNKTSYFNSKGWSEYFYYNINGILEKSILHDPKTNEYITSIYDKYGSVITKIIDNGYIVTIKDTDPIRCSNNTNIEPKVFQKIFIYINNNHTTNI